MQRKLRTLEKSYIKNMQKEKHINEKYRTENNEREKYGEGTDDRNIFLISFLYLFYLYFYFIFFYFNFEDNKRALN